MRVHPTDYAVPMLLKRSLGTPKQKHNETLFPILSKVLKKSTIDFIKGAPYVTHAVPMLRPRVRN